MDRRLVALFLTIFVNLIGFGIIIPLLPFYAESFGASPLQIGLLFSSFSISQLIASPLLGAASDRWGRRPVLMLSLVGTAASFTMLALAPNMLVLFAARIIDGLSGGNITTARAYVADVTTEENRAKGYGVIGAAFGLGFIVGPGLGAAFAVISYTAPIWVAVVLTLVALAVAWIWLPETVHRVAAGGESWWRLLPGMLRRRGLGRLLSVDFLYWMAFAMFQTTFALFGERRFGFGVIQIGYLMSGFGVLGVIVQVGLIGRLVAAFGEKRVLLGGLTSAAIGIGSAAAASSVPMFALALLPVALGMGLCNPSLASLLSRSAGEHDQGRVQGTAGALESLGRTLGPVLGNGLLQRYSEGWAYAWAAALLALTLLVTIPYRTDRPAGL